MKVAYILNIFPKISETFILNEVRSVVRKGVDVVVFAQYPSHENVVHPSVQEVRFRYLRRPRYLKYLSWMGHVCMFVFLPLRYFKTWRIALDPQSGIREMFLLNCFDAVQVSWTRPDQLHAHFGDKAADRVLMIHLLTGIPFTFTTHSYDLFGGTVRNYPLKATHARKIITISEFNKDYLVSHLSVPADRIQVVHCGVELKASKPDSASSLLPSSSKFLTIARLHAEKGIDVLIRACALLKERGTQFICRIAGDGGERQALEQLVAKERLNDRVEFLGAQPHDEIFRLLSESTAMVLPSRSEGIPVSLMEAMAVGIPVIATRITGIPELIEDGVSGLLVPSEDAEALASAMQRILEDIPLRARLVTAGREKIEQQFDLDREVDKLVSLWSS